MKDHVLRFKDNTPREKFTGERESVESFLARGGKITQIALGESNMEVALGMPNSVADQLRYSGIKGGKMSRR